MEAIDAWQSGTRHEAQGFPVSTSVTIIMRPIAASHIYAASIAEYTVDVYRRCKDLMSEGTTMGSSMVSKRLRKVAQTILRNSGWVNIVPTPFSGGESTLAWYISESIIHPSLMPLTGSIPHSQTRVMNQLENLGTPGLFSLFLTQLLKIRGIVSLELDISGFN